LAAVSSILKYHKVLDGASPSWVTVTVPLVWAPVAAGAAEREAVDATGPLEPLDGDD
jgi:hypothetical protein